jgi:RimJ/RimL family protein N-acetyltransferase
MAGAVARDERQTPALTAARRACLLKRMDIRPVTLEGRHVRLEPLDLSRHWEGLKAIGLASELWRFTSAKVSTEAHLKSYFEKALAEQASGGSLPFVTIQRASGRVAGSTRFGNITREHKRVEIGWTWLGLEFQRSALNTEAKYLMLGHAFETWGCMRVELKTSLTNLKSRAAMRRLGLVEEGMFRKWMFNEDGTPRDTVWFSCIDDEWPEMKTRLEGMLARYVSL